MPIVREDCRHIESDTVILFASINEVLGKERERFYPSLCQTVGPSSRPHHPLGRIFSSPLNDRSSMDVGDDGELLNGPICFDPKALSVLQTRLYAQKIAQFHTVPSASALGTSLLCSFSELSLGFFLSVIVGHSPGHTSLTPGHTAPICPR